MVSLTKRLRIENSEKFTTRLHAAPILFAWFSRHTENSYTHRHRTGSLQKIRGSRSAKLSIWHSIYILGTIHQFALFLVVDHFMCIGCGIHLRWNTFVIMLGGRSHNFQFSSHTITTTWRYDIFKHQIISHTRCYSGAERWALSVFHRTYFTGNRNKFI